MQNPPYVLYDSPYQAKRSFICAFNNPVVYPIADFMDGNTIIGEEASQIMRNTPWRQYGYFIMLPQYWNHLLENDSRGAIRRIVPAKKS